MSDQNVRLNLPSTSVYGRHNQAAERKSGILDGTVLSVLPAEDDVDEQIEISFRRQSYGLDAPRADLLLKQMKLEVRDKPQDFGRDVIQQYLKKLGHSKNSAELAQNILQRLIKGDPLPPPGKSPMEVAEFSIALQRVDAALRGSDSEFVEWLSPLKPETPDLSKLAKQLQDAGDDAKQMQSLLSDFRGLPSDEQEIFKRFGMARFDLNQLKRELQNLQQLPLLDEQSKFQLAEKVKDEINELHRQHGSHLLALRNLLNKAGDFVSTELAESYDDLVHGNASGFAATMELLATRHPDKSLLDTVIPVIEKTLSHELGLSEDQRSVDKEKLRSILSELQHMNILKSLIERLEGFVSALGRLYGLSAC